MGWPTQDCSKKAAPKNKGFGLPYKHANLTYVDDQTLIRGDRMSAIGWIAGVVTVAMVLRLAGLWFSRRRTMKERTGERGYPGGGEMADLNRLLQEGVVSPEEYELLKRRILAGQVY